ncbi:MAG TPA: outer membrane beta-barrel protein [Gemmatimonadaceae bacterium]|nr:outer membrane beta-barrel protein [Gemmatimonadaceae bacterium]
MIRLGIATLALVLLGFALPTATDGQTRFGLAAGVAVPSGDFGDATNTGVSIEGTVEGRPGEMPFAIRGDIFLARFGLDEGETGESGSIRAFGLSLNALFQLLGAGVTPYLLMGPSLTNLDVAIDGTDDEAEVGTNPGVNLGGGVKFLLSGYLGRLEVRWSQVFSKDDDVDFPNARWVTVTAGVLFGGRQ